MMIPGVNYPLMEGENLVRVNFDFVDKYTTKILHRVLLSARIKISGVAELKYDSLKSRF